VGIELVGGLAALDDDDLKRVLPGKTGRLLRDRANGVDPRQVECSAPENVSISQEETFARDVVDREQLHAELRRMALNLASHLEKDGRVARTVTAKLRYPDFSIRSRSQTLPVGSADGELIGELACALLDRGLTDRPGALRLVGVGVSNLEPYQQLALA
jgi:DNA polymerase-4